MAGGFKQQVEQEKSVGYTEILTPTYISPSPSSGVNIGVRFKYLDGRRSKASYRSSRNLTLSQSQYAHFVSLLFHSRMNKDTLILIYGTEDVVGTASPTSNKRRIAKFNKQEYKRCHLVNRRACDQAVGDKIIYKQRKIAQHQICLCRIGLVYRS